ncbi:MAG: LON peptidase substrate-binding domain-containing protein [Candidatus Marinimicrobia bacterium]|nr:LON peptidase substrate-binding domain-containing protein [Candidatus Neomarinimicrobiota bacterium]MCH7859445.1 LON peptidase substrate-binding domain-containing protein [Candidatus Neomarinimicrobiota bacterium]
METVDELLKSFSGTTPLFPLPGFVFFPKTVQPFHIFEPRYIDLVNDCMAGEHLVTIPLLKAGGNGEDEGARPFHGIATMGYINQVQELHDEHSRGEQVYNILVTGLVKVEIAEVESEKAYRRGAVTPLPEFGQVTDAQTKQKSMLRTFRQILEKAQAAHNLELLMGEKVPIEMVTHIIISALPIAAEEKQKMLELQSLELRINILQNFLDRGLSTMGTIGQFKPILPTHPLWN